MSKRAVITELLVHGIVPILDRLALRHGAESLGEFMRSRRLDERLARGLSGGERLAEFSALTGFNQAQIERSTPQFERYKRWVITALASAGPIDGFGGTLQIYRCVQSTTCNSMSAAGADLRGGLLPYLLVIARGASLAAYKGSSVAPEECEGDRYVMGRLAGSNESKNAFLDRLSLGNAIALMQAVGSNLILRREANNYDCIERVQALTVGHAAFSLGRRMEIRSWMSLRARPYETAATRMLSGMDSLGFRFRQTSVIRI
jgi:hypothetical protein